MDQAALQRVTLARPSGTLCGTARKDWHMDRVPPFRIRGYSAGPPVGRVVFFLDFLADPLVLLCCNALQ